MGYKWDNACAYMMPLTVAFVTSPLPGPHLWQTVETGIDHNHTFTWVTSPGPLALYPLSVTPASSC